MRNALTYPADSSAEISILPIPTAKIRELFHGNLHFANSHGLNQEIVPWKYPFRQFPRTKSEISTMEIFISPISTALIRESFHGNLHLANSHGPNQEIVPWKSSFRQFPRTKSEISTMEIPIITISTAQIRNHLHGNHANHDSHRADECFWHVRG